MKRVSDNLSFAYLMDIYPSDNIEGVLFITHDEVSKEDIWSLPADLINKLRSIDKFNDNDMVYLLNEEISLTISF